MFIKTHKYVFTCILLLIGGAAAKNVKIYKNKDNQSPAENIKIRIVLVHSVLISKASIVLCIETVK